MIIADIFEKVKEKDLILGLKLENCHNIFKKNSEIDVIIPRGLVSLNDKIKIEEIIKFEINFVEKEDFPIYPFPVQNSKYNNFVTLVKKELGLCKLLTFRKDKTKQKKIYSFKYSTDLEIIEKLYEYSFAMIDLLKKMYRFHQIVLSFYQFNDVETLYNKWSNFLNFNEKEFRKFNDILYFHFRKDCLW